jgi:molecular chaperone Hsp33
MSLKKQFQFKDRLIKGIHPDGQFKISVVKTTDVVRTAQSNHNLSLLNTVLLGKTLTAAMLLASELKGEERIQIRIDGDGPIGNLTAEANRVGEVRGYSHNPSAELDYHNSDVRLGDGLGLGVLTVTKTLYNEAEPRKSSIQLVEGDINTDIAHYMAQSEQVLSAFLLDVGLDDKGDVIHAGGVLVQRLPEADDESMTSVQETLTKLPPLSELFSNDFYIDEIMELAVKPFQVKELDRQPVHFFCRCSPKRFKNALSMLGYEELKEMTGESQEVVCHYCGTRHTISEHEIEEMAEEAKAKLN